MLLLLGRNCYKVITLQYDNFKLYYELRTFIGLQTYDIF
jgi:hypothetical protein